jgi:hypothetical protein
MITVGRMAREYHLLPSDIVQRASTYDMMIMDVLATYENYIQQKASGKVDPSVFSYSTQELQKMMEKTRVKNTR